MYILSNRPSVVADIMVVKRGPKQAQEAIEVAVEPSEESVSPLDLWSHGGRYLGRSGCRSSSSIERVIVQVDSAKGRLKTALVAIITLIETGVVRNVDDGSEGEKKEKQYNNGFRASRCERDHQMVRSIGLHRQLPDV